MEKFKNAENVVTTTGRQYHIGLTEKEISDKVILVGDPERATLIASFFNKIRIKKQNREFLTYTGNYQGIEITVMSVGIGAPAMEIAVIELSQLKFPLTIIRCGSCGALQDEINIGDLVISSAAIRLENTTNYFVEKSYPAIPHYEATIALLKSADESGVPYHYGLTATAPGFYGAQERNIEGFPLRKRGLLEKLAKQNVKNLEMECATLFTLATLRGIRSAAVCSVFASRTKNIFVSPDEKTRIETQAVKCALNAFLILEKIDKQKKDSKYWIPKF